MEYFDPIPPLIEEESLQPYHSSLAVEVKRCAVPLPENLLVVGSKSPREYREAVEELGSYFCHELNFDNRPYCAWEHDPPMEFCTQPKSDDELRAFLFIDPESSQWRWQTFGAACFRFSRSKKKDKARWVLAWIWLHHNRRRQNHLTRVYPFFRNMFGDFAFREPISTGMLSFLEKTMPDGYWGAK